MKRENKAEVEIGEPEVAYREAITSVQIQLHPQKQTVVQVSMPVSPDISSLCGSC